MKYSRFLAGIVMGFSISYALLSSVLVIAPAYAPPTISTDDIEDNAITSPKIKDGEIMTSDIANGAVTKDKLNPNAVKLVVVQREKSFTLTPHSQWSAIIQCNADEVVTGGGFATGGGKDVHPTISAKNANGWAVALVNIGTYTLTNNKVLAECTHLELGP